MLTADITSSQNCWLVAVYASVLKPIIPTRAHVRQKHVHESRHLLKRAISSHTHSGVLNCALWMLITGRPLFDSLSGKYALTSSLTCW